MKNLFDVFKQRGFVEQTTGDNAIYDLLQETITCYIGFDPTAPSFHVGNLIPIMALAHLQRHGHRPIALVGGATALVGDPSGKTEMRQMLTEQQVSENADALKVQLARFMDFENDQALLLNNADWLAKLQYIPFLRDIGRYFSVNRMLASESCRLRLETGLSFIEFNYSLLQAYDFLYLYRRNDCVLQMGGADQWGNILAGIDLIRRVEQGAAHGLTFPLITTSSGDKMGKTAKGAVWLDPNLTSPYDYYQFWINTSDADVTRFLLLFTFLPRAEIEAMKHFEGSDLNAAKTVLSFEATKLAHGEKEAVKAYHKSANAFGVRAVLPDLMASSSIHRFAQGETLELEAVDKVGLHDSVTVDLTADSFIEMSQLADGIPAFKLFHSVGLADSRGAARRLIEQGGGYVNGRRIDAIDYIISDKDLNKEEILLRAGKKRYHRIKVAVP